MGAMSAGGRNGEAGSGEGGGHGGDQSRGGSAGTIAGASGAAEGGGAGVVAAGGEAGDASAGQGGAAGAENATSVRGIVTAFRPNAANLDERVPGALVTINDGSNTHSALSDGNGNFEFAELPPGAGYHVKVTVDAAARKFHDGMPYGDWYGEVSVSAGQTTSLMPRLNLGCTIDATISAGTAVTFSSNGTGSRGCGAYDLFGRFAIPAGGLVRANGEAFTGSARLEFNPIWFPSVSSGQSNFNGLAAMPPLLGVPSGETAAELMHTFAAADVRVLDRATGEVLALAPGTVADLTLRGFRELTSEDAYSSWSFDPESGRWREEGACTPDATDPQLIHCEVKHFSWWNADGGDPEEQGGGGGGGGTRCIFGGVLYQGKPLVGASVLAVNSSGITGANAHTDEAGAFCALTRSGGGKWDVQVRVVNGRNILSQQLYVDAGALLGGDCNQPLNCAQAGVIELESSPAITVHGKLGLQVGSEEKPMPTGGFDFGRRVRAIGSPDEFGFIQLNLGEFTLDADGGYEFDIPEAIVRLFFASPTDGECKTYPSAVPGSGERVAIEDQFFVCGS